MPLTPTHTKVQPGGRKIFLKDFSVSQQFLSVFVCNLTSFHSRKRKGYPVKARRVLLLSVAQVTASLCLHGLMPIARALNTRCKALRVTKNRWRRSKFNSGLPGHPINSLIHGSFWTRHSQSHSSLGAHSSGLTLFAGARPGRSTGLVTIILPGQH